MSIFYLDPELGNDATSNTPLGWWSRTYTSGNGTQPTASMQAIGNTSGKTANVTVVIVSSGTWAGGNASGTLYWYGMSGAFVSETLTFSNGATCSIAGAFTYCAWKTVGSGATSARIAAGDIIRMKKSPAPIKLSGATGQATWTDLSKTVTLAEAQTVNIDMCETAWTANPSGDTTVTRTPVATDAKEGSYCMKLAFDAAIQNSTLQAYFATGTLNLSSYYRISFWIKTDITGGIAANQLEIALCSDTAGTTVVDSFPIPAGLIVGNTWTPITIIKSGGGSLGASIQSICIKTGSSASALASKYIYVDDFIACTLTGLNLLSLITKNSAEQGGSEGLYPIQSINGVTVLIDNNSNTKAYDGQGYTGTTETVDTYFREGFNVRASGVSTIWSFSESGSVTSFDELQGGFDPVTNLQDGETIFDGASSSGVLLSSTSKAYWVVNWIQTWRYMIGIYLQGSTCNYFIIDNFSGGACGNEPLRFSGPFLTANNLRNLNNNAGNGLMFGYNCIVHEIGNCNNNISKGIYSSGNATFIGRIKNLRNNKGNGIEFSSAGNHNKIGKIDRISHNINYAIVFKGSNNSIENFNSDNNPYVFSLENTINFITNANIDEAIGNIAYNFTPSADARIQIDKYNGDNSLILGENAKVLLQTATAGGTGKEWAIFITSSQRDIYFPFRFKIARIYCNANKTSTLSVFFKKSHASDIAAHLICRKYQLEGLDSDIISVCPSDTNRNELSIQISPTSSGVVEIEVDTWYVSNVADENIIVDGEMTLIES